jgi:hypothetical protein
MLRCILLNLHWNAHRRSRIAEPQLSGGCVQRRVRHPARAARRGTRTSQTASTALQAARQRTDAWVNGPTPRQASGPGIAAPRAEAPGGWAGRAGRLAPSLARARRVRRHRPAQGRAEPGVLMSACCCQRDRPSSAGVELSPGPFAAEAEASERPPTIANRKTAGEWTSAAAGVRARHPGAARRHAGRVGWRSWAAGKRPCPLAERRAIPDAVHPVPHPGVPMSA